MAHPAELKYTETHEWCRMEGDTAVVGITQHAAEQLTDLVYVDLPKVGDTVTAGQPFGEIESVKAVGELNSPVSGKVVERNEAVAADPTGISADPHGSGWLIRIKVSDRSELDRLMDGAAYDASLSS